MTFDVQKFIDDIRFMHLRYQWLGTRHALKEDLDLVQIDWDDPDDQGEPQSPLGAVAVSPEEFKAIKEYLFAFLPSKPTTFSWGNNNPQRNVNNPRQFRLFNITIQVVNAQSLFLEHLDPDSIAAKFTGIDESVYYHNNSPP